MILRGGQKKPFHLDKLTKKQWDTLKKCPDFTCGLTNNTINKWIKIPNLIFKNNCILHDLGTSRGGGLLDFYETNYYFWRFNYSDTLKTLLWLGEKINKQPYINRILGFMLVLFPAFILGYIVATTFSLLATIGDVFVFSWGQYKTFTQIINKRCNYEI